MTEEERKAFNEAVEAAIEEAIVTVEGGLGISNVTGKIVGGAAKVVKALKANDFKIVRAE